MRKFHRTMNEAFPYGPDYGCAIQAVRRSPVDVIAGLVAWAIMFGGLLTLMLAYFDVLVP